MKLPKISLGTSNKRAFFDKSHNYNGTTEFGFCLPTLFDEIEANTKIRLNTNTFVRLGVLPQPSFAPIKLKQYNNFVPIHDVFEAYDYFIAQQTVQSAIASYVPSEIDNIKVFSHLLSGIVLSSPCAFDSGTYMPLFMPVGWMVKQDASEQVVTRITNYESVVEDFIDYFKAGFGGDLLGYTETLLGSQLDTSFIRLLNFGSMLSGIGEGTYTPSYLETTYPYLSKWLYMSPTFDNADFTFKIKSDYASGTDLYLTIHLTHEGKRLFKVLQCIGYQFAYDNNVSVLPLYAYYKTWFDLFQPHREVQWKQTFCYKLIHGYYDTGEVLDGLFSSGPQVWSEHFNVFDSFFQFLHEIPKCCYTLAVDPVTVARTSAVQGNTINRDDVIYDGVDEYNVSTYSEYVPSTSDSDISIAARAMLKLLPMINKNSVIGARVDKYMQLHYGVSLPQNFNFGKDEMNINISDVFSTSDTYDSSAGTGSALGEYAGKGLGYGNGNTHKFESNRKGFIFQISCIVPVGSYSQSMNPLLRNLTLNEQYLSEYDGLGMAPMHKSEVFGTRSVFFKKAGSSETFGFRPRLFEYKIKYNVRAGGFANRSERFQFMPYQLDRVFTEADYSVQPYLNDTNKLMITDPVTVLCDDSLRYIGNDEDYGNYDRIFEDQLGVTDNFIIHIVHDYGVTSPMLPISQSFDTFDNEGLSDDNGKIDVTHA